ncbi:MAG: adenosine deaminase [Rhodospirillales bacterium]|nr:adenosine deaminase [Rhodospirillales bacterium]
MKHRDLIAALPKAELHLHIEGSMEPEMMFELAARNGIDIPYANVEEVRSAYNFTQLQDFLDIYYEGMAVLREEQDLYDLTMAYLKRSHADNVRHVEMFFDPQGHTTRGIAFETAVSGISRALNDGKKTLGMSSYLILSFLRHLSEEDAFETLAEAEPYLDQFIGVGLDSSEIGHPPSKFARVFARAREMGLKLCAHSGEEGPPDYVREALDILHIDRMDHGNRSMEDESLVQEIVDSGMVLTVCPLSNLKLGVIKDMTDSPVRRMLDAGIAVTLNSDDPAYFGGYMNANFEATADALNLTGADIITLVQNSFQGSFLPPAEIATYLEAVGKAAGSVSSETG